MSSDSSVQSPCHLRSTNSKIGPRHSMTIQPNIYQTLPVDLPTLIRTTSGSFIRPRDDVSAFLATDLDVSRLDAMVEHGLWLAGRVGNIRPLHRQKVLGRRFVITEHLDFHLLWNSNILFVKPLPSYILDDVFIQTHIAKSPRLTEAVNGFLLSYARLINYKSDFDIAKDERLIPSAMDWTDWQSLFDTKLYDLLDQFQTGHLTCSPRFCFGELRLSRVDYIYRFHPAYKFKHSIRGYCTMPATYQSFLTRNFAWLLAVFAYLTIVLTAMQVGQGTVELRGNHGFDRACYGFTIFSMILPAVALVVGGLISVALTFYHVGATRQQLKITGYGPEKP